MLFTPWKPDTSNVYIRFYVSGGNDEYLHKTRNGIQVHAYGARRKQAIEQELRSNGVFIENLGLRELHLALSDAGLLSSTSRGNSQNRQSYSKGYSSASDNVIGQGRFGSKASQNFSFKNSNDQQLYQEALYLDASSAPFKDKTINDAVVLVDHREPVEIFNKLLSTKINNVNLTSLPDGDYLITSKSNPNRVLLIERKTVTDLYVNITGHNKHAHEQAERYYHAAIASAKEGVFMQVIWIVEGEKTPDGQCRGLYNVLPEVKHMDGWINYISGILGQQTISTFNSNHTAYMIAKLIQGFVEESLYYPVKVMNRRIDLSASDRRKMNQSFLSVDKEASSKGVIKASDGLQGLLSVMPGINTKIAKELASKGLTFAEIVNMSVKDLKEVKGIGEKSANKIWEVFNQG